MHKHLPEHREQSRNAQRGDAASAAAIEPCGVACGARNGAADDTEPQRAIRARQRDAASPCGGRRARQIDQTSGPSRSRRPHARGVVDARVLPTVSSCHAVGAGHWTLQRRWSSMLAALPRRGSMHSLEFGQRRLGGHRGSCSGRLNSCNSVLTAQQRARNLAAVEAGHARTFHGRHALRAGRGTCVCVAARAILF